MSQREQFDKYGSRQLTELENLRAERDAYKQQAEFSAGEIKRLQLNAGIFEDVKAARDNAERDANALRAQLSMRSSKAPTHCDLCCKPKTEQPCGATHCPGNRLSRELVIETARELFGFYGWDNERDQKMRKRIEVMRNMALSLLSMPSATLSSPPLPAKPLWGTGWVYGNNYKQRGRPAGSGKEQGEPWYVTEDGMLWSSFDVRYRPDVQSDIEESRG